MIDQQIGVGAIGPRLQRAQEPISLPMRRPLRPDDRVRPQAILPIQRLHPQIADHQALNHQLLQDVANIPYGVGKTARDLKITTG